MPEARPFLSRRVLIGLLLASALVFTGTIFFLFDPARHSFYPTCLLHKLTGLNCPGCGSLRALHHLTRGNFATAFFCNPLLIALLPFLIYVALRWLTCGRETFNTIFFRPLALWVLVAVTVVFTVLRNLPWPAFAWMSP